MTVDWNLSQSEIERRSFALIDAEAGDHGLPPAAWTIVRRMIHTTADFEYMTSTIIHPQAIAAGVEALKKGADIFTDTRMAAAGVSKRRLEAFGATVECLINDPQAADRSQREGVTRAAAAVDAALTRLNGAVYVIGNAPTALFRLLEHIRADRAAPALIVGLPVGFVNAAESKQALAQTDTPHITNAGRKGGSNVAASVVNALAELALGRE
jgi:precorrin-8X/cobalt-precorrin-8 methylmutase